MNKTANNHADFARPSANNYKVTEVLRPKYGHMATASMPANIEMAIRLVGSYY